MFERLRAWRTSVAEELVMPPNGIFDDATLRLIAARAVDAERAEADQR